MELAFIATFLLSGFVILTALALLVASVVAPIWLIVWAVKRSR